MRTFCCCWTTWGAITWHTNWQASLAVRTCFAFHFTAILRKFWLYLPAPCARFDNEELKTSRTLLFSLARHSLSDSLSWKSCPAPKPWVLSVSVLLGMPWNARCWLSIIKYGKSGCSNHFRSPYKQTQEKLRIIWPLSPSPSLPLFSCSPSLSGKRTFSFVWRERFMKMQCYLMEYEKIKQQEQKWSF